MNHDNEVFVCINVFVVPSFAYGQFGSFTVNKS